MVDFIPFIPYGTPGVSDAIWNTALKTWNVNLVTLLNMQTDVFLEQVMSNTFIFSFIDQVLNEQMNNTSDAVDSTLLKNIFLFYSKLTSLPSLDTNLLNMERLCSFVIVYGESNSRQVRDIMNNLISNSESLEQSLLATFGMLIDAIQSMPNLLFKSTNGDTLNRAYVLVRVLDALLSSTIHIDCVKESFDTLDIIIIGCYRDLIPCLKNAVDQDNGNAGYAYLIKFSLVSTFNSFADIQFFIPLGYQSSTQDHHQLEPTEDSISVQDTALDILSEKLLGYIENSGLDSSRSAFIDGPLVMDWEIEFHITDKLNYINQHKFQGEEDRIEFLKLSMEQVRDSNEGTNSWGDLIPQKRQTMQQQQPVFDNVERTSKISQIHDLFPDLGDGFIEACLDVNDDDTEMTIMQLLEDNLPTSVSKLDRTMKRKPLKSAAATVEQFIHLESDAAAIDSAIEQQLNRDQEQESVLKTRKNIYDNDEFDIFAHKVDTSKVYTGKKNKADADSLLDDKSFVQNEKQNLLKLAVDMYDDDYDDTYDDINDSGVPSTMENGDGDAALDVVKKKHEVLDPSVENESILVHAYAKNPEVFARNAVSRKSKERLELKKQTNMSDEQLQGWASMFAKNPRKDRILDKYLLFDGNQVKVTDEQKQEAKKKKEDKRPPVSEARDKAYKDKNKARFGNHNRKANRDKKIAKTAPPPS